VITIIEYKNQKIGVFGLGKAGEATVASLLAGNAQVFAWDDKYSGQDEKSLNPESRILNPAKWPWNELKALILSPGIPLTHPKPHEVVTMAKRNNCPIIGDIELLYRACPNARYIGITGTNGKSTTTTLIGHILKMAGIKTEIGGNLGTPALSLNPLAADGTYVLELSSYQLDLVKTTRFNVAVLLNITPDHLDRHGDMEGYIATKMHIFERQQKDDTAAIAVDDEYTKEIVLGTRYSVLGEAKYIPVSARQKLEAGIYVENGILYDTSSTEYRVPSTEYDLTPIPTLTGRHNWQNAAAAWAVARACGVAPEVIYNAMRSFPGLRHRLQLVATIRGVRFINDSKATNADATANALAPYDNIYWIAGGKPKAGGIVSLAEYFPKIVHAFLIGEAEDEFARTLEGKVPYTRCGTLDVAVQQAAAMAFSSSSGERQREPGIHSKASANGEMDPRTILRIAEDDGSVVLLSPACASFDQFKNFEERGDRFCELVEGLSHAP